LEGARSPPYLRDPRRRTCGDRRAAGDGGGYHRLIEAGYDSYEDSRALIERLFLLAEGESPRPGTDAWGQLRATAESLFAPDVHLVTRDGVLSGPQRIFDDIGVQLRRFELTFDLRQVLPAPDGRVVAVSKMFRRSREDPAERLWNLGGGVYGVRRAKIVFFEGYPNARRACEELGIDPDLIRA
jgi:hypothetical protein